MIGSNNSKRKGANLVQIKSVLLKELEPQGLDEKVQDNHKLQELKVAEASEDGVVTVLLNEYKSAQKEVVESHKNVVKAKDELIVGLKQQMFLLTDGRTPEEIRIRRKEEKVEQKELQQVRLRRVSLIGELKALEGKLFSGQKRLEILKQLEEIC